MNINFKFLLLGTNLSLIPNLTQAQCVATTDCATLGYTEKSCPDGKGLKCPFGNTFACPATEESICEKNGFKYTCNGINESKPETDDCGGKYSSCYCQNELEWNGGMCHERTHPQCEIGWIYYSDNTCSENLVKRKIPLGIVVYLNPNGGGQALALREYDGMVWGDYPWNSSKWGSIPNLPDLSKSDALRDYKSCENTAIITDYGGKTVYYAAWTAKNYVVAGAPETAGKWCLPAAGIGQYISDNFSKIQKKLKEIGGQPLSEATHLSKTYYTSTEASQSSIWAWDYSLNYFDETGKTYNDPGCLDTVFVRPVIEF